MHRQGAGGRGHRVIRIGAEGHRDRMGTHAGELGGIGRQGVVEHIAIHGAGHNGIQSGIDLAIALALRISRDGGCRRVHRQGAGGRGHRVIRIGAEGHRDRMAAHSGELGRIGRQTVVQNVAIHGAGHNGIQRGVNLAVVLALGIGCHRGRCRMDRQGAGGRGHRVVRIGPEGDGDGMAAHSRELGRIGRQAVVQNLPVHGAGHNGIERRINLAVGLALGIGNHCRGSRMHRQGAGGRGHRVVRVRAGGHRDRIGTHAGGAGGSRCHSVVEDVPVDRPGDNGIERRVGLAVGFGLGVGRDGGRLRADAQGGIRRGDGVVRVGTNGDSDRIRTGTGGCGRSRGQCVVQHIAIDCSRHSGIQRGIRLAVGLALGIGNDGGGFRTDSH